MPIQEYKDNECLRTFVAMPTLGAMLNTLVSPKSTLTYSCVGAECNACDLPRPLISLCMPNAKWRMPNSAKLALAFKLW